MSEIEHGIADQHRHLVMFATKCARKRLVLSLHNYAFPHPLPELFLCGPELFAIATNDQRRFLFLLLLFFLSHFRTTGCQPVGVNSISPLVFGNPNRLAACCTATS